MKEKWLPYFSDAELKCRCGNCDSDGSEMNGAFMDKLMRIRSTLAFPLIITSAYRCSEYNDAISSSGENGPHTTGRAIDIAIRGEDAISLIEEAIKENMTGFGINQKGTARFIHLDDLIDDYPRPTIWSY